MANLDDVVDLIKTGDSEIIEKQEEANTSLESIDRNIMEFLGLQKRQRLDDLEDRREKKSRLNAGKGALVAGGAGLAAAGTLGGGLLGEGTNLGRLLTDLAKITAAAVTARTAIKAGAERIRGGGRGDGAAELDTRTRKLQADADAKLKDTSKKLKIAEDDLKAKRTAVASAEQDLEKARNRTVARGASGRFEALDPRTKAAEIEIKEKQLREAVEDANRVAQERADLQKAQAQIEMRRVELEAIEADKLSKRKKAARIAEMEAADAEKRRIENARDSSAQQAKQVRDRLAARETADAERLQQAEQRASSVNRTTPERLQQTEPKVPALDPRMESSRGKGFSGATALRGLNLLDPVGQAEEAARLGSAVAGKGQGGFAKAAAKALGGAARVLGSTAFFAGSLIVSPTQLADGTMTALAVNTWNDIITLMTEGGPSKINDIMFLHAGLTKIDPSVLQDVGLGEIQDFTKEDYLNSAKVLNAQFKGLDGLAITGQQTSYASGYGRKSSALGVNDRYDPRAIAVTQEMAAGPNKSERFKEIEGRIAQRRLQIEETNASVQEMGAARGNGGSTVVAPSENNTDNSVRVTNVDNGPVATYDPRAAQLVPGFGGR